MLSADAHRSSQINLAEPNKAAACEFKRDRLSRTVQGSAVGRGRGLDQPGRVCPL